MRAVHVMRAAQGVGQLPDPVRGCQEKLEAFEALGAALRRGDPGMQADLPSHMDRLLAVLLEHLGAQGFLISLTLDHLLAVLLEHLGARWPCCARPCPAPASPALLRLMPQPGSAGASFAALRGVWRLPARHGDLPSNMQLPRPICQLCGCKLDSSCPTAHAMHGDKLAENGGRRRAPAHCRRCAGGAYGGAVCWRAPVRAAHGPPNDAAVPARRRRQGPVLVSPTAPDRMAQRTTSFTRVCSNTDTQRNLSQGLSP